MKKKSVRRVAMKFQKIQTLHLRYKILLCTVSAVHSSLAYHAFSFLGASLAGSYLSSFKTCIRLLRPYLAIFV